jgi:hypothetical protein
MSGWFLSGHVSDAIHTVVDLDEPEDDDVTVFIEVEEASQAELLRLYEIYRDNGGAPYEPYESMLAARDAAQRSNST